MNTTAPQAINMRLPLGQCAITPGAMQLLEEQAIHPLDLLARHATGDWGDLCEEDREANRHAVSSGLRVLSSFQLNVGKVYVITEWDRSVTTILLPSEY